MPAESEPGRGWSVSYYNLDLEAPLSIESSQLHRLAIIHCGKGLHKGVDPRRQGSAGAIREAAYHPAS